MPSLFPTPSPELPEDFGSLLVQGNYHASAPFHLAMSYLAQRKGSTAIIITPSRKQLVNALQKYQDDWIRTQRGRGDISALSSRIKLFYPPSPAHVAYLMMMFSIPEASTAGTSAWINGKMTFSKGPSLLILHEISSYFEQDASVPGAQQNADWTLSSYLSLVTHSLSFLTVSGKACNDPTFALFDSGLAGLKLPMMKRSEGEQRLEQVSQYLGKYFYWFAEAVEEDSDGRKSMLVYQQGQTRDKAEKWTYREHVETSDDIPNPSTHILWH